MGGVLYAGNHPSVLITTSILFIVLSALAGFVIGRSAISSQASQ